MARSVSVGSHIADPPELDQLRAHISALMPYRVAAGLLTHLLPVEAGNSPETLRGLRLRLASNCATSPWPSRWLACRRSLSRAGRRGDHAHHHRLGVREEHRLRSQHAILPHSSVGCPQNGRPAAACAWGPRRCAALGGADTRAMSSGRNASAAGRSADPYRGSPWRRGQLSRRNCARRTAERSAFPVAGIDQPRSALARPGQAGRSP
jgi:hypothetical protein